LRPRIGRGPSLVGVLRLPHDLAQTGTDPLPANAFPGFCPPSRHPRLGRRRSRLTPVSDAEVGSAVTVHGTAASLSLETFVSRTKSIASGTCEPAMGKIEDPPVGY